MPYSPSEIAQVIKDRIASLGMNYQQFADRIGKTESAVKQIVNGTNVKSWTQISVIADVLELSPNELLGFERSGLPTASLLAEALEPLLAHYTGNPDIALDVAQSLLEVVEDARSLSDGEPDPRDYRSAGRACARQLGRQSS